MDPFFTLCLPLKCPALSSGPPPHRLPPVCSVLVDCLKYENEGGGWAADHHTQRRPVTHTELSSDSISIPLLAQLQSAQRPPQLSYVAAIIFVERLRHKTIWRVKPVD